jgi:putative tricarboxylic transport membrane protein
MSRSGLTSAAKGELVFTSFLFLAGVVVLTDTTLLPEPVSESYVSPKVFGYIVGLMLTILPVYQITQIMRGKLGVPENIEGGELSKTVNWPSLAIAIGALLFYTLTIQVIGFILSAGVLFFGLAYALGAKRLVRLGIIAFSLSTLLFIVFTQGLNLPLPLGFEFITGIDPTDEEW